MRFVLSVLCLIFVGSVCGVPITDTIDPEIKDIFAHLRALQEIADKYGSRAVATGYNSSAEYVTKELTSKTDYVISHQPFVVPVFSEIEPPVLSFPDSNPAVVLHRCSLRTGWQHYETACDYAGVRYGGSGKYDITSTVHYVGKGCKAEDFAGFPAGKIALIETGVCEYFDKGVNAEEAGASAVILFTELKAVGLPGGRVFVAPTWREGNRIVKLPFIGLTYAAASALRQYPGILVRFQTNTVIDLIHTYNIFAETKGGDESRVVMIGAHLDGVPEGPGINDNGSGTSVVLALAQRLSKTSFKNKVRFAWWGAEEIGLLGSYHYVRDLAENSPAELKKIVAYVNFDMEASPNYIRLVYNGTEAGSSRAGSEVITHLFEDHFRANKLSFALTSMSGGGSDFFPFMMAGVPSSGLAAGASGLKSIQERAQHKGLANAQLDPCYHAPCDGIENVSPLCITEFSHAASDVLLALAEDQQIQNVPVEPSVVLNSLATSPDVTSCFSDEERPVF